MKPSSPGARGFVTVFHLLKRARRRRACFALVALVGGAACAHAPVAPPREDRDAAILRRWSRAEATAEEVRS